MGAALLLLAAAASAQDKPNIGVHNISAYNHGIMGYQTPNIDRIAKEGALFTDFYAQQSCTAGRSSFILGMHPLPSSTLGLDRVSPYGWTGGLVGFFLVFSGCSTS